MKFINSFFLFLISVYQYLISPWLGRNCRFSPTCSSYAKSCFEKFPFHKALWYSTRRILRCHPFGSGGFDPVPDHHHHGDCCH